MTEPVPFIEWGAAMLPQPGQPLSGDDYLIHPLPDGLLVAVIDGLGHGPKAALAARLAVETLRQHAQTNLIELINRCHQALTGTRGAVISLAAIHTGSTAMNWLGVGNVAGLLARSDGTRRHMVLRGGVVGYHLPPLRVFSEALLPGDTLIFATDGIRSSFTQDVPASLPPQALAEAILANHSRQTDDATVVVGRYTA